MRNNSHKGLRTIWLLAFGFWLLAMGCGPLAAQNVGYYVVYSGSHYMAHVKEGDVWKVKGQTTFSPDCIWLSNTNNYWFEDATDGTLYLRAEFAADAPLQIATLSSQDQLSMNAVGVSAAEVHTYYFYNWDWGMALGRQLSSGTCPTEYNSPGSECWEAYWVVYADGQWKMSSTASYDILPHAANFRKVRVNEHEVRVTGYSGGIGNLADHTMSYNSSYAPPLSFTNYIDTIQPAYTTYMISDIECTGNWPDRTCDTTWTVHNYYGNADHGNTTPAIQIHPSHTALDNDDYNWTLSGDGAAYLSFDNSDPTLLHEIHTANPTIYFRNQLTSGDLTATLTVKVTYDGGATQTRTATITLTTQCGNPRITDINVDGNTVTVNWAHTSTEYNLRYRYEATPDDWIQTVTGIGNVTIYTLSDLSYASEYVVEVAAVCSGPVDWTGVDSRTFTTGREPKLMIGGAVFGGGRMADIEGYTVVTVANCDTITAVYGGNDIAGHVTGTDGSTIVVGNSSTVNEMHIGSVYGGGNGFYTYNSVSDGAALGTSGINRKHFASYSDKGSSTTISVAGDIPTIVKSDITVGSEYVYIDSLFGGAKNAYILKTADNEVTTNITIDNGTIYAVFGGNNIGGELAASTVQQITVNKTKINKTLDIHNTATTGWGRDFGIRYLFGGGNKVYAPGSNILMAGGQVDSLFGGGNSATVGAATVLVNCHFENSTGDWVEWDKTITKAVYSVKPSSSWSATVGTETYSGTDYNNLYNSWSSHTTEERALYDALNDLSSTFDSIVVDNTYNWNNKGTYNIRALFGGNNLAAMNIVPTLTLTNGGIGTVYGGGNAGPMKGKSASVATIDPNYSGDIYYSTHLITTSPYVFIDRIYGGCQQSDVDWSTWVDLNGGNMGYVFGGCNVSGDVGSTRITSGANYYDVQGGSWVDMKDGRVHKNVFGGSDGLYHCNNDLKYISGVNYTDKDYVGMYIPTHNETHVYMTGGTVLGSVYAGGNLANVGFPDIGASEWTANNYPNTSGLASVHISGGKVVKNVFGGGNMASIYGINDVLVDGGEINGALYGGNDRAGSVRKFNLRTIPYTTASDGVTPTGNITTYVRVTDKPYINTIFGGGNGDYDYSENSDVQLCGDPDLIKPIQTGSFVDINIDDGGYGTNTGSTKGVATSGTGGGYIGTVYGGGDGVYVNGSITVFLNVKKESESNPLSGKDNVGTIFGGNNKGNLNIVPDIVLLKGQTHDVYGGSNQGIMNGIIEHNIAGVVEIGSYVRLMKRYYPTGGVAAGYPVEAVVSGNVYGGCRLSDVTNSTLVLVEGGNHSNVRIFGGNDISGTVNGTSNVIVDSLGEVKEIYGGGNGLYKYNSNGNITVSNYLGTADSILATVANPTRPYCANTDVKLRSGQCDGNVYGGGLAGDCGNTELTVRGDTKIMGNLFGGGCGIVDSIGVGNKCSSGITHKHVGNVTGTATTTLHSMDASSASTLKKVYGGGHNSNCANTVVSLLPTFRHSLTHLYGGCVAGDVIGTADITIRNHDDGTHTTVDTLFGGNDFSGLVKNTVITIDSGRFHNVFGAGNGYYKYGNWLTAHHFTPSLICVDTVPYSMDVTINFNGGYYVGNVYGGGNLGLVGNRDMDLSLMTASADSIARDTNIGRITVNIHNPAYFARHVFAGARGLRDMKRDFFKGNLFTGAHPTKAGRNVNDSSALGKQLVYGQKIVNMDGGIINLSLYGGSESVDDGFPYECIGRSETRYYDAARLTNADYRRVNHNSTMRPSTVINMVGGNIRKNVYGSGYQGNGYGSVYVNIGRRAVNESPVWTKKYGGYSMAPYKPVIKNANAGTVNPGELKMGNDLILEASVYNGSDWGEAGDMAYFNTRGFYGSETNIFVDGDGYYTSVDDPVAELQYPMMNISFNLIGSGISTEGGDVNRLITMRHYGYYYDCESVSRELFSIQRADKVILDSVFILLKGEQDAFSAYTSPNYSLNRIDTLIFLNDNIITIEAPGTYIGNLVSMKPNVNNEDPTYNLISTESRLYTELSVMEANLHSTSNNDDCNSSATLNTNCDQLSFCDKLPVMRGEDGYTGKYNTLVMRNGCYVRVASFIDEHDNNLTSGQTGYNKPDGKDDATTYGHVKGWMYMTSEDNTQSYVYAADKVLAAESIGAEMNTLDGGFVGLCKCENVSPFTNFGDELNYEHVNSIYRSWRVGTYLGRRTRNISLVANSEPDGVLNWNLPTSGTLNTTTNNGEATPVGSYTINSTTGNDHLAYATTIMELPPSEPGNFYIINEVIVDQDNGYQMQLVDQGYEAATNSVFSAGSSSSLVDLSGVYGGSQADRNKTFALTFSSQFDGSHFAQTGCWNSNSTLTQTNGPDAEHRHPLTEGGDRRTCWPISSISGNPYWSTVNGYLSRAVDGVGGVVPSLMFTLTYDKRLSSTLTRDVLFVMDEYDAQGNYVGPVDVTVTISTVIRDFNNMNADVYAIYNEGVSNMYSRVVTIPSSFMERGLYLKGIEWENNFTAVQDPSAPITPTDEVPNGTPSVMTLDKKDWFYLQDADKPIAVTTVSDNTRHDDGKTYLGNNLFSIIVTPSENSSDKTNNHLAWMDINDEARDLDVYQTALEDYKASKIANGGNESTYTADWDFTNADNNPEYNKTRKYDSYNYNDATVAAEKLKTKLSENPLYIGTLDGRSTAGIEVKLNYNGDYVYHDCLNEPLGVVKLHFYWENTKYQNSEEEVATREDRGEITLTINLFTREQGDTIYMAPGNSLTRYALEPTTANPNNTRQVTVNSWHVWAQSQNPVQNFGPAQRNGIINNPDRYVNTFREALTVFIPGDVIAIMQTIPVNSSTEASTVHGDDFNRIQLIRYSGSHAKFPTLGCANRNALIEVKDNGRLYLRNVWINGSGCTRTKYFDESHYSSTDPLAAYNHRRAPGIVLAHAPVIYCHNHGEVDMSANVWISNNFNRSQEKIWQSNAWVDNPDVTHIDGGAMALVKDLTTGVAPKVVMGDDCKMFDNFVVDWKEYYKNNPISGATALTQPLNYGGAIYMNGGALQFGTTSSEVDNDINISRNFYLIDDTNMTNPTRLRTRYELSGNTTSFQIYYLDTVRHPESFRLSNIHLTRLPSTNVGANPVRRDAQSDMVSIASDFTSTARIGINKWFPGYRYSATGHYLANGDPRDTIIFAVNTSHKPNVAANTFANNVFFNDSSYYYDENTSHYEPYRASGVNYNGHEADSLAPRFVLVGNDYTSYHNATTEYPDYNDQVWRFYNSKVSKNNLYLQRCATFGAGMRLVSKTETVGTGSSAVTLRYNDYEPGDSIYYLWDKYATCVASTDTIISIFGGGFFPYTYQWFNDVILDDNMGNVDFHRTLVRQRTTDGDNSISNIMNSDGTTVNTRNQMKRIRATHDTLVLRSLIANENSRKSTYFYDLIANDVTGHCSVNMPVMIRVAKLASEDDKLFHHGTNYLIDSANFLRHRNPFASYGGYHDTETGDYEYYSEFPVSEDTLKDDAHPELGAEIKYSGISTGSGHYDPLPTLTPTQRDQMLDPSDPSYNPNFYPNAYLFKHLKKNDKWCWMEYNTSQSYDIIIHENDDPNVPPSTGAIPLGDYYYYRLSVPGVDSSSFHDHVAIGKEGTETVFYNANGVTLYPYIMEWDNTIEPQADYLAGINRSDTVGYEIRKEVSGTTRRYRTNAKRDMVLYYNGSNWVSAESDINAPQLSEFWPDRRVPYHFHGEVSDAIANRGGIQRSGYSHVPMHWYSHGYNRGTLEERLVAESFSGKPYSDDIHVLRNATFYSDAGKTQQIDTIPSTLYASKMVPRYFRSYRSYHIYPDIYPSEAKDRVEAYPPDVTDFASATPLNLATAEFCPGDIVQLVPVAATSSTRWPGENPHWRYVAWDFDASSDSIATFVVSAINQPSDTIKNQPVAYFTPGDYWWQHVTHLPPTTSYVRHNNGDVTIKDSTGLAWLISVVNGYNGQNARTFRYNKVFIDFDSVNMSRYKWTPVGNQNNPFEGEIVVNSGKKAIITGITVSEETVPLLGMFGYTNRAKLNGISLDSALISGVRYVGGLVGFADTNTQISKVSMKNIHLFGEQYTGGIAAQSYRTTFDRDTIRSVSMRGNAVTAGGVAAIITGSMPRNTSVNSDIRRLSAIYFGGAVGRIERDENPNQPGGKSENPSRIENNYIHIVSDGTTRRVGGVVGYGQYADVNNNYVYGVAEGADYTGGLVGFVGSNFNVNNCYYVNGMAKSAWGYNTHTNAVNKYSTFSGQGKNVILANRVDGYTNMLRALNRWVFTHGDSIYSTWRSAEPGENGGYPVFGDPEVITVIDSVEQTICDEIEWDGITFSESGRYIFHVVDSSDYLDSTFILHLTVNHGDSTNFSDSVALGSSYTGYGINISANEIRLLFGNDMSREVVAIRYVDSLLTTNGCDSLVVLTLYVVNGQVTTGSVPQKLTDVRIYPNPTRGIVNVEGEELQSIEVYDNVSRRILSREATSDHERFDLSNQPAGSYYIRVKTANGTVVQKLIKK